MKINNKKYLIKIKEFQKGYETYVTRMISAKKELDIWLKMYDKGNKEFIEHSIEENEYLRYVDALLRAVIGYRQYIDYITDQLNKGYKND